MKRVWTVEFLDDAVEAEFLAIPKDLQARLVRITDLIEAYGLSNTAGGNCTGIVTDGGD